MRRLLLALPLLALLVSAGFALTAGTTINDTDKDDDSRTQSTSDVTPSACKDAGVNARASGNDLTLNGGTGNDFLMGDTADQSINGFGGDDCLYGGAGNDTIDGGTGTNYIDGGPGTDTCLNAAPANKAGCEL
jgi:Ca2+-binding RTX toxin-like protein